MDSEVRDTDRWMLLAGPVFLVLFVIALAIQGDGAPEKSTGKAVISKLADHHDGASASVFLVVPLVVLLLLFAGAMRNAFGSAGGAAKRLFQYGAVLYAAGLVFGATLTLAIISAVDHKLESAAEGLNVLAAASWIPVIAGAAVMLIGAGLAVLRTGVLPAWMGWIAAVAGVVSCFGPGGFAGFLLTPLWIAVAGTMVYLRASPTEGTPVI